MIEDDPGSLCVEGFGTEADVIVEDDDDVDKDEGDVKLCTSLWLPDDLPDGVFCDEEVVDWVVWADDIFWEVVGVSPWLDDTCCATKPQSYLQL